MSNPYIHHFDNLLKEIEDDIARLNVLMHQAFVLFETVRGKHLMVNETYQEWCGNVRKA